MFLQPQQMTPPADLAHPAVSALSVVGRVDAEYAGEGGRRAWAKEATHGAAASGTDGREAALEGSAKPGVERGDGVAHEQQRRGRLGRERRVV